MTIAALAEALGGTRILGKPLRSPLDWVEAVETGFPPEAVEAAIERGILTRAESEAYVIPRRTLAHRRQRQQRLTLEESDRLSRIARLTARAAETFGSQEAAMEWLRTSNGALEGTTPLELLKSGEGAVLVEQLLIRIDHGIYT